MNNNDYIYNLVFKNKEGKNIDIVPLFYETPLELEIPKDTLWIEIKINRLIENKQYQRYTLYNLIVKDILDNKFNKAKEGYYITTSRFKYYPGFSNNNLIIVNTNEELTNYIKNLIQFFHEHSYEQFNGEEKQQSSSFSKKLSKVLTKNNL